MGSEMCIRDSEKGLAEEEAFRFIQSTAMDGRESMLEVSKRILGES